YDPINEMESIEEWRKKAYTFASEDRLGNVMSRTFELMKSVIKDGINSPDVEYNLRSANMERKLVMNFDLNKSQPLRDFLYGLCKTFGQTVSALIKKEQASGGRVARGSTVMPMPIPLIIKQEPMEAAEARAVTTPADPASAGPASCSPPAAACPPDPTVTNLPAASVGQRTTQGSAVRTTRAIVVKQEPHEAPQLEAPAILANNCPSPASSGPTPASSPPTLTRFSPAPASPGQRRTPQSSGSNTMPAWLGYGAVTSTTPMNRKRKLAMLQMPQPSTERPPTAAGDGRAGESSAAAAAAA
ncbi:hypothetical protein PFISCL1PPCAC_22626, partial [Pristionchus fissidentatus]